MPSRDPEPPLSSRLPQYEALIAFQIYPLVQQRTAHLAALHARREALHARADVVQALCLQPQPAAFQAPIGAGVLLHAEVDLRTSGPVLVDVGTGLHLEMAPLEALAWLRKGAAEAVSEAAVAERSLRAAVGDLQQACSAVATLTRLAEKEAAY